MRKADVTFHSDGFGGGQPAVNVKNYDSLEGVDFDQLRQDNGIDSRFTLEWITEHLSEDALNSYWEFAVESSWDLLQTDAEEYAFWHGVKVYSEGRSGGWAVVHGLPEFESWDAVMLAKWARFCKAARDIADDLFNSMAILIAINKFDQRADETDKRARVMVALQSQARGNQ